MTERTWHSFMALMWAFAAGFAFAHMIYGPVNEHGFHGIMAIVALGFMWMKILKVLGYPSFESKE